MADHWDVETTDNGKSGRVECSYYFLQVSSEKKRWRSAFGNVPFPFVISHDQSALLWFIERHCTIIIIYLFCCNYISDLGLTNNLDKAHNVTDLTNC